MTTRHTSIDRLEILIAEDSTTQAEHLRELLEQSGYTVTRAENGAVALESARARPPALIVSDVIMPELDGYGLCRAIKDDERLKHIPVVLVTTLSDPQDIVRGLECRADNFIRKPYDERELVGRVEYLLMNLEVRRRQKMHLGIEITIGGTTHFITAERQQILDMLITTYEQAVDLNAQLSERQRELATANTLLAGMYGLAQGLNRETSEQGVATAALERALTLPGIAAGWILVSEPGGGTRVAASVALDGIDANDLEPDPDRRRDGHGTVAEDGGERRRGDRRLGERRSANTAFRHRGASQVTLPALEHGMSVPLRLGERTIGDMNLLGVDDGAFDAEVCTALDGVGRHVAVALERAWLHEKLERRVEERTADLRVEIAVRQRHEARVTRLNRIYSVLSSINGAIVRVRDLDELFRRSCDIAVDDGSFAFAWIGLGADGLGDITSVWAASSDAGESLAVPDLAAVTSTSSPRGCVAAAVERGDTMISNDIATDDRLEGRRAEAVARGYRSMVVLPLMPEGRPVGSLTLYANEAGVFDDEEMRLLTEIADAISFAMDHIAKAQRLQQVAYYDDVTGLPNRACLMLRLEQAISEAAASGAIASVCHLDLDRFKVIVDSLGYAFGNRFLKEVGARLEAAAPAGATVARLAGDEFAVVLGGLRSPDEAASAAERLLASLALPIMVDTHELFTAASLGIALYPQASPDAEKLVGDAEIAMYNAKGSGGGTYEFFGGAMSAGAAERLALEVSLRHALDKEEFLLHYQPVVSLETGSIIAVEALVRWQSPERGLVSPGEFIPLAEETGLIVRLGEWVLEEACSRIHAEWAGDDTAFTIAVNVSARQFHRRDLVERVLAILRRTGLDPAQLTLEITESHLMRNVKNARAVMRELGDAGIRFSIDDFGTGYSSLAYLSEMPIANLKIDRSFVSPLPESESDAAIVTAMIAMAHNLGITVIAEGVETEGQLEFLRRKGCDAVQGYLLGRPAPADEIEPLLCARRSGSSGMHR